MINSSEFAMRLEKILEYYEETASSFADKIGVQRSSISHIISGRNKPSLDFVLKILSAYPEVELYWLLNGKGKFPSAPVQKSEKKISEHTQFSDIDIPKEKESKEIERIIIFYSDGTFKNYIHQS